MRASDSIGAEDDLQIRSRKGTPEQVSIERQRGFHLLETFLGVVADAEEVLLVIEIVLDDEADLGIEPGAALGHELEIIVSREGTVLNRGAAGQDGRADRGFVGVHNRAEALPGGLTASGRELLVG